MHCLVSFSYTHLMAELRRRQRYLRDLIKSKRVDYNYHDSEVSFLEAVFAKGDRRLGEVLIKAWEKGCKMDGWSEFFDFDYWMAVSYTHLIAMLSICWIWRKLRRAAKIARQRTH